MPWPCVYATNLHTNRNSALSWQRFRMMQASASARNGFILGGLMWIFVSCFRPLRPKLCASIVVVALLLLAGAAWAANEGTITSLSASDAPAFNQTVTVNATFSAIEKVNNTGAYY